MNPPDRDCRSGADVLARFLDGDDRVPDAALHLRDCAPCRETLRRARRLDALLAQASVEDVDDAVARRLLARACPDRTTAGPSRLRRLVPAGALLLTGAALGSLWPRTAAPDPRAPAPADHAAPESADAAPPRAGDSSLVHLPGRASRTRGTAHPRDPLALQTPLRPRLPHELRADRESLLPVAGALALARAVLHPGLRLPTAAEVQATSAWLDTAVHVAAGEAMLRSPRPGDREALLAFLAGAADGDPVASRLLAVMRRDAAWVRRIRSGLSGRDVDDETVTVAARLGTPRVDAALVQVARRDRSRAEPIARSVAGCRARPAAAGLLLDLWAAGTLRDDVRLAAWMHALPADATDDLIARARQTRRHDERLRCLRALAWRSDPRAAPFLLELVEGPHQVLAREAGYALSRLAADVFTRVDVDRSRRPHLLLAALFGMRSERVARLPASTTLSDEESEFLLAGRFSQAQYDIAVRLCRRHLRPSG